MIFERMHEKELDEVCDMIDQAFQSPPYADFYPAGRRYFQTDRQELKRRAAAYHFYVMKESGKIVACGGIGPYEDRENEALLFSIAVSPEHRGKGYGRKMIGFLESDEYALRARRIEIHAALSAIPFYRHLGYEHKNGVLTYANDRFDVEKYTGR